MKGWYRNASGEAGVLEHLLENGYYVKGFWGPGGLYVHDGTEAVEPDVLGILLAEDGWQDMNAYMLTVVEDWAQRFAATQR